MGSSQSAPQTRLDPPPAADNASSSSPPPMMMDAPPQIKKVESFEEKVWRKFTSQPLVPIGCVATAYFLASGIKSFSNRDPVRSQKMMRNRVAAQFATIMVFIGYMGADNFDLRLAPMYQDSKRVERMLQQEAAAANGEQQPPSGK